MNNISNDNISVFNNDLSITTQNSYPNFFLEEIFQNISSLSSYKDFRALKCVCKDLNEWLSKPNILLKYQGPDLYLQLHSKKLQTEEIETVSCINSYCRSHDKIITAHKGGAICIWNSDCQLLKTIEAFPDHENEWGKCDTELLTYKNCIVAYPQLVDHALIKAWDIDTFEEKPLILDDSHLPTKIRDMKIIDNILFVAGYNKNISAWDLEKGEFLCRFSTEENIKDILKIGSNLIFLEYGALSLWDLKGNILARKELKISLTSQLFYHYDTLIVVPDLDGKIYSFNIDLNDNSIQNERSISPKLHTPSIALYGQHLIFINLINSRELYIHDLKENEQRHLTLNTDLVELERFRPYNLSVMGEVACIAATIRGNQTEWREKPILMFVNILTGNCFHIASSYEKDYESPHGAMLPSPMFIPKQAAFIWSVGNRLLITKPK